METDRSTIPDSVGEERVGGSDKLVLCLFRLVFLGFGLILAGDLLSALLR